MARTTTLGKGNPVLGQFGFSTALPQPSSAPKAAVAAKAKLTKKARGTDKGRRQRHRITPDGLGGVVYVAPASGSRGGGNQAP